MKHVKWILTAVAMGIAFFIGILLWDYFVLLNERNKEKNL